MAASGRSLAGKGNEAASTTPHGLSVKHARTKWRDPSVLVVFTRERARINKLIGSADSAEEGSHIYLGYGDTVGLVPTLL